MKATPSATRRRRVWNRGRPGFSRTQKAPQALLLVILALASCGRLTTDSQPPPPRAAEPPGASPLPGPSSPAAAASSPAPGPSPEGSTRPGLVFAVKGDWGAGTPDQSAVSSRMCAQRKLTPFNSLVTTGDNFYGRPDGQANESNYYRPEACLVNHPGHQWRATWGNHDVHSDSTATVLGARDKYYQWSDWNTDFFMLDSNRPADPYQLQWLQRQLESSTAKVKIAVFHHPPYTVGGHDDDQAVKHNWVPLFERFGVQLVLSGHNHDYEHSKVNGIDYVVSGGGGASLYSCERRETWALKCQSVHHFLIVEVTSATLKVRAIDKQGGYIDEFERPIGNP